MLTMKTNESVQTQTEYQDGPFVHVTIAYNEWIAVLPSFSVFFSVISGRTEG